MDADAVRKLPPKGSAQLLGLAVGAGESLCRQDDETMGELLRSRLDRTWQDLPLGAMAGSASAVVQLLDGSDSGPQQRRLREVLTDPGSDLVVLRAIRKWAKQQAQHTDPTAEHVVALTIYFAAIANALVYHRARITTASYEALERSFGQLLEKHWMPGFLAQLFGRARQACKSWERPSAWEHST